MVDAGNLQWSYVNISSHLVADDAGICLMQATFMVVLDSLKLGLTALMVGARVLTSTSWLR